MSPCPRPQVVGAIKMRILGIVALRAALGGRAASRQEVAERLRLAAYRRRTATGDRAAINDVNGARVDRLCMSNGAGDVLRASLEILQVLIAESVAKRSDHVPVIKRRVLVVGQGGMRGTKMTA